MTFYFDYGDDWHFLVECLDVYEAPPKTKYPQIIEGKGHVEQYPPYDEGFDDEESEDVDEDEKRD